MGRENSALARVALENVFADFPQSDAPAIDVSTGNPFADDEPDDLRLYRGRVPVTLSTRIELRGYPTANVVMQKMARAWALTWHEIKGPSAVARLAEGWRFSVNKDGVTEVIDASGRCRALSKIAGGEQSFLKVLPRYFIGGAKGFEFDGVEARWELGIRDRQQGEASIHWIERDGNYDGIESGKADLLQWLDERYPSHRDPFAYWSDTVAGGR